MLGELTQDEINEVMANNITGRIGCTDGEKMYIVPVSYAYNDNYVVVHSKEGLKIDIMRQHPHVCFQVDEIINSANWRSVIVWGDYEEITDPKEKYYAMKYLVGHLAAHQHVSETAGVQDMHQALANPETPEPVNRPVVYRIRIKERSGRFEKNWKE
ncbi:pyridoxamine 5'-phosphate oxidase family protein [Chitinophaga sp. 212800010-3]|uniref:pyridoxamine 5'-phosphate oxidase family protein n=1 Tax=unclassified Chitinophaga TaxID=2619133 RepID=UPI002DF01930|nr:Pyridoxamine 5'-phosphate oxidase family protein [Chitinophaga sp. 212800010-3]